MSQLSCSPRSWNSPLHPSQGLKALWNLRPAYLSSLPSVTLPSLTAFHPSWLPSFFLNMPNSFPHNCLPLAEGTAYVKTFTWLASSQPSDVNFRASPRRLPYSLVYSWYFTLFSHCAPFFPLSTSQEYVLIHSFSCIHSFISSLLGHLDYNLFDRDLGCLVHQHTFTTEHCYDWITFSPNSYVETLIHNVTVFGDRAFS